MTSETWRRHPVFVDYDVSDQGRVRRAIPAKGAQVGRVKAASLSTTGYLTVNLDAKPRKVHVLVLETFVGPRPPKHDGCHNDGDRQNNALENLRWATRKENMADAITHGTAQRGAEKVRSYWGGAEARQAQSERVRAFNAANPEHHATMIALRRARVQSSETREKMRHAKLGTKQPPEVIAKRVASYRATCATRKKDNP